MKKKILSLFLVFCFMIPCAFGLVACGGNDGDDDDSSGDSATAKVMNVSLNPKLEFVLDKNDKVVSVNALNDDGNNIISISIDEETQKSLFEGLTADEAIELFLEISEENGYLISGDEEEIKIEISGSADELIKKVKSVANKFFDDNNLDVDIVIEKFEKSDIIAEVKNCMKEYDSAELNAMTEEQLIEMLKKSRQETSKFFTQELKEVYYNLRLEKLSLAELESLYSILTDDEHPLYAVFSANPLVADFVSAMESLKGLVADLEEAYTSNFLAEGSDYNNAKDTYISEKENLLAQRKLLAEGGLTDAEKTQLGELEEQVATAKSALETAKATAESNIVAAKTAVSTKIADIEASLSNLKAALDLLNVDLEFLDTAEESFKNEFKNHFEKHDIFKNHLGHDN